MDNVQIEVNVLKKLYRVYSLWWNTVEVTDSNFPGFGYISSDDQNTMTEACEEVEPFEDYIKGLLEP